MDNAEASVENGPQHINLDNLYVYLNNPELLNTVTDLKSELQTVK